jgi:hypothetical protein
MLGAHLESLGAQQAFRVSHGLLSAHPNLIWRGAVACDSRALHNLIVNADAGDRSPTTFSRPTTLTGTGRMPAEGEALIAWMAENEASWRLSSLDGLRPSQAKA